MAVEVDAPRPTIAERYAGFWIRVVAFLIDALVIGAVVSLFWSAYAGGQTVGMRVLRLRVIGADGLPIHYANAVVRWVGIVISAAALLLGLLWVGFDRRKQGWHDKIAGTFVVHAGEHQGGA